MTPELAIALVGGVVVLLVLRWQRRQDIQHGELSTWGTWAALQQNRERYRYRKVWLHD